MPTHRHLPIAIALFLAPAFTVGPASAQQLPAAIAAPGNDKDRDVVCHWRTNL